MEEHHEHIPGATEGGGAAAGPISFVDRHGIHPLLFALFALSFIFLLYQLGGGFLALLVTGTATVTAGNVWTVRWLTMGAEICFILVPTIFFAKLLSSRLSGVFRFRIPGLRESTLALIALFSLQRVFDAYLFFQERFPLPKLLQDVIEPIQKMYEELVKVLVHAGSPGELLFVIVVVAVVPAIAEEMLFRGLIQRTFERLMSPVVSAVLAGTVFGLYHLNPSELVPLIGLGVFFGLLRYRSQSLVVPMVAHFLNNLMAVLAAYYDLGDKNILAVVQSNTDVSMMLFEFVVFSALFFLAFVGYLRLTHDVAKNTPPG
jgi:membrane protease YdiL (CAAX protease family)